MAVYFHGNYGMNRGRMARIIGRLKKVPEATHREIGEFFGYSQSYAARYRSWMHKCGLVLKGRPFQMTEWGEAIVEHDRALESRAAMWFLHWQLVTHLTRAEVWHHFYHRFLSCRASFGEEELLGFLTDLLRGHSEEHFGPGSRLTRSVKNKLVESYLAPAALGPLGILLKDGRRFLKGAPEMLGPWDSIEAWAEDFEATRGNDF